VRANAERSTVTGQPTKAGKTRLAALLLGLGASLACLVLGVLVASGELRALDENAAQVAIALAGTPIGPAAETWQLLGELRISIVLTVGLAGWLLVAGAGKAAALVAASILAGGAGSLLKLVFLLPRPPGADAADLFGELTYGYPSGHVIRAVVLTGVVAVALAGQRGRRWWLAASAVVIVVGGLVGAGRMIAGQHYLSDVAGGLLLGLAWLALTVALWRGETSADRRRST